MFLVLLGARGECEALEKEEDASSMLTSGHEGSCQVKHRHGRQGIEIFTHQPEMLFDTFPRFDEGGNLHIEPFIDQEVGNFL